LCCSYFVAFFAARRLCFLSIHRPVFPANPMLDGWFDAPTTATDLGCSNEARFSTLILLNSDSLMAFCAHDRFAKHFVGI
jgi:hypothetical protein